MRKMLVGLTAALAVVAAHAATESELLGKAMKGDYQAQRNLAYSYATGWGNAGSPDYIQKTPEKACTWYRVIAMSRSPKVNGGDYSNEYVYCSKLMPHQSEVAWVDAKKLLKQIPDK
ncbi:hypothetical protein QWZ03_18145 [Chitinimonas viridis]|uniref:Uncharacterized protein n=1 Tax=Chitinimonas viridis TaxID=664880 RepID=A0ABT8B971_9NEIS|nr:hypothetical protein [Chitinimonas viridis]MDN3578691.1 hypothetical protein [Chitinimonas viridis]